MADRNTLRDAAVQRYLASGDHDLDFRGWAGSDLISASRHGSAILKDALVDAVLRRSSATAAKPSALSVDIVALTRSKVAPMVTGLFPQFEQAAVLAMLERSVVVLRLDNVETVLRTAPWLATTWRLANLYLLSVGCEPLSVDAPRIVGVSQDTTCYVSLDYFVEQARFADFVVHEAAHVFHNCKRSTVGLKQTRSREWLLSIEFRKRETFAYACEAYSRILAAANTLTARMKALDEHADGALPGDGSVDLDEYLDILDEAVTARNGWKWILQRCAPPKSTTAVARMPARLPALRRPSSTEPS
jgi:hypothetical protein